jgi:hypothetical protein
VEHPDTGGAPGLQRRGCRRVRVRVVRGRAGGVIRDSFRRLETEIVMPIKSRRR